MPPKPAFLKQLRLPVIAAPMFLVSGTDLVVAACRQGIVGTFPALNARTDTVLDTWLTDIGRGLNQPGASTAVAPYGVNLIVHKTNKRLDGNLKRIVDHKVPLVITSLGAVRDIVDAVHSYGGVVFHDVTNVHHARKAISAGVDGLIAVCAGAGGHAGVASPFALVPQLRSEFDGAICLAGAISDGHGIRAARALGADLAYMACGLDPDNPVGDGLGEEDFSKLDAGSARKSDQGSKAWKDIWSAGQGVININSVPTVADLVQQLEAEFKQAFE
ncbi:putative 2-nitropropane dioxygenase [Entophlyctis helioformis]|nr:putative 2-nitropropane dioxygenase [Entophlyctis helioformis]